MGDDAGDGRRAGARNGGRAKPDRRAGLKNVVHIERRGGPPPAITAINIWDDDEIWNLLDAVSGSLSHCTKCETALSLGQVLAGPNRVGYGFDMGLPNEQKL